MSLIHGRSPKNEAECGRCGTVVQLLDLRRCGICRKQICSDCRGSVGDASGTIYYCSTEDSECWA